MTGKRKEPSHPPSEVKKYFAGTLREHGTTFRGVDWPSEESQRVSFEQLMKVCDARAPFSLIDYGCGYGALVRYLKERELDFTYCGCDVAEEMITAARDIFRGEERCRFHVGDEGLHPADYTVASGVFNKKFDNDKIRWRDYVIAALERMDALSRRGFAFNLLTLYSEKEKMRDDLYYADPCFYFDYCKSRFSRHVALLHDYGKFEFTVLVRKDGPFSPVGRAL